MMGRTHALSGAAAWLAAAPPVVESLDAPLGAIELAAGTVVAAGAALLPDLDHRNSTIARALGPGTVLLAVAVSRAAGGHRNGTHSLAFLALAPGAAWLLLRTPAARTFAVLAGLVCVALALRAAGPQQMRGRSLLDLPLAAVAVALTALGSSSITTLAWLPVALAVGIACHLLGDLGGRGIPLLWPLRRRCAISAVPTTGGPADRILATALLAVVALLTYQAFLAPHGEPTISAAIR